MQTIHKILKPIAGTAAALAIVTLAGCSSMSTTKSETDRSAGRVQDDKKIAATVKHALDTEPVYKFTDVKVDAYKGVVQLSGFVDAPEQKQRATEVAKNVPWVRDVVNNLTLKPNEEQIPSTTGKATGERGSDATTRSNTNSPSRTTTP